VRLWDVDRGTLLHALEGHTLQIRAVALSADGRRALSGADDRTMKLWDAERGTLLRTFDEYEDSVAAIALSADGQRALSGSHDRTVRLWDSRNGATAIFTGDAPFSAVALGADGDRIAAGDVLGRVHFFALRR
jgi:WD40 repeat protein